MEREQIIKALEYCINNELCDNCPVGVSKCHIIEDALALIKELTEENEFLSDNLVRQSAENVMLTGENKRLQKTLNTDISIVRVSRGSGKTAHLREVGRIKADAIRADTVREMQERLKDKMLDNIEGRKFRLLYEDELDQIAKEILEEG